MSGKQYAESTRLEVKCCGVAASGQGVPRDYDLELPPLESVGRVCHDRPRRKSKSFADRLESGLHMPSLITVRHTNCDAPGVSSRRGQKRILSIDNPLVFRVSHGRWRGASWVDEDHKLF